MPAEGDGEGSQEDTEGSDTEVDHRIIHDSRRCDQEDEIDVNNLQKTCKIKEEVVEFGSLSSPNFSLPSDVQVKEEPDIDSNNALRQLMALETVANASVDPGNDEVVCIGESTRLSSTVSSHSSKQQELLVSSSSSVGEADEVEKKTDKTEDVEDLKVFVERMRKGWTVKDIGCFTIGHLYLMVSFIDYFLLLLYSLAFFLLTST